MTSPSTDRLDLYQAMMVALFPRGRVWFDSTDGSETKELTARAMAKEPARVSEDMEAFVAAFMPDTATTYLSDWERVLELSATGLTDEQRRQQIITKLRGNVDPTLANIQIAADAWNNGAVVTEHAFPLFEMGVGAMGDALRGDAWASTLLITYNGPQDDVFEAAMLAAVTYTTYIQFEVV